MFDFGRLVPEDVELHLQKEKKKWVERALTFFNPQTTTFRGRKKLLFGLQQIRNETDSAAWLGKFPLYCLQAGESDSS